MAEITPAVRKAVKQFLFQEEFEALITAYEAGVEAMERRGKDVETGLRQQLLLGPNDPFPESDPNDPDDPLELLYEHAAELGGELSAGKHVLRKTFTIALFHLWERHGLPNVPRDNADARHLNSILQVLRRAANCAKHTPGSSAERLLIARPDLFPNLTARMRPSERFLVISESTFEEFVSAITALVQDHRTWAGGSGYGHHGHTLTPTRAVSARSKGLRSIAEPGDESVQVTKSPCRRPRFLCRAPIEAHAIVQARSTRSN